MENKKKKEEGNEEKQEKEPTKVSTQTLWRALELRPVWILV